MADKKFDLVFNASLEVGQVKSAVASLTKKFGECWCEDSLVYGIKFESNDSKSKH